MPASPSRGYWTEGRARLDASLQTLEGDCARAARLFGAGENLREAVGASVLPAYRQDYDRGLAVLRRRSPSEHEIQAAWDAGRRMALDEALRYALDEAPPDAPSL